MTVMMKRILSLLLILTLLTPSFTFANNDITIFGDLNEHYTPENKKAILKLIKPLQELNSDFQARQSNYEGRKILIFNSPEEILDRLNAIYALLESPDMPEKLVLPDTILDQVENLNLVAFFQILHGRDELNKGDGSGWYLNHPKNNGIKELIEIINHDWLPLENIDGMIQYLENLDVNSPRFKAVGGFLLKRLDLGNKNIETILLTELKILRQKYSEVLNEISERNSQLAAHQPHPFLVELINKNNPPKVVIDAYNEMLAPFISLNNFNSSVADLRESHGLFDYKGQEKELLQIVEALNRTEQSHVFLTGKRSSGKKTLIKRLSDAFAAKKFKIRNQANPPIILTLTTMSIAAPAGLIGKQINAAEILGTFLDREVVLHIPDAHLASPASLIFLKEAMNRINNSKETRVHIILSTNGENKRFFSDPSFLSKMIEVNIHELSEKETKEAISAVHLKLWLKNIPAFRGIREDALNMAINVAKNSASADGSTSLLSATKQIIEGSIAQSQVKRQQSDDKSPFILTANEIMEYAKSRTNSTLVPGDKNLSSEFEKLWANFDDNYTGQLALKDSLKKDLFSHFSNMKRESMTSFVLFGPPGTGKSFLPEQIANSFFKGAILTLSGGEFQKESDASKILGSAPGYVGSNEKLSLIGKFVSEHPEGGVILVDEADYVHADIEKLLTNMVTSLKMKTGTGEEYNLSKYLLFKNSNIGQDRLLADGMNWEQYKIKRQMMTENTQMSDGRIAERVKPDVMKKIFEQFIHTIVTKANPNIDTKNIAQEAEKQFRRYKPYYIFTPTKEELKIAARNKVLKYIKAAKLNYNVTFNIEAATIESVIDIENFEFEKGYSYVMFQLNDKLFQYLNPYLSNQGETVDVSLITRKIKVGKKSETEEALKISMGGLTDIHGFGVKIPHTENQWANSPEMKERIENFSKNMNDHIKGMREQIEDFQALLKLKSLDWKTRLVTTNIGSTGNGKTEFYNAVSMAVFNDPNAIFKISDLNNKEQLNNYFRSNKGFVGSNEETRFERWFKARLNAGGGVILLDELLSFNDLDPRGMSEKAAIVQAIYTLLDEGYLEIGGVRYDARSFIIGITGNAMQEEFYFPDTPEAERQVEKTLKRTTTEDIVKYLTSKGMDAPKVARFGKIYLNGPLKKSVVSQIAKSKLKQMTMEIEKLVGRKLPITIADEISQKILDKSSTMTQGMRKINNLFSYMLHMPIAGIIADLGRENVRSIEAKIIDEDKIEWFVNHKRVVLSGEIINDKTALKNLKWKWMKDANEKDFAPSIKNIKVPKISQKTKLHQMSTAIHEIYGHFMVDVLANGKNLTEVINLIPGEGYLGFVRPKDVNYQNNLSSNLKQIVSLEAGHRAVFYDGLFSGGGGSGDRNFATPAEKKALSDDLGRIQAGIEYLLSSNMVGEPHEFSAPEKKQMAIEIIRTIGKEMADFYIKVGRESSEFKKIFDYTLQEGFVTEEYLDVAVKEINWSKFGNIDDLFINSFMKGVEKARNKSTLTSEGRLFLENLEKQVKLEIISIPKIEAEYDAIMAKVKNPKMKITIEKGDCASELKSLVNL